MGELADDLDLFPEQWGLHAGRQLGNTPKAFSHVSLVNTAFTLPEPG
ncbi:glycoside hydrolase family 15 protein [Kitasatospora aureofaciens]|nr:glycoside hydrolase family 15 protein [Kitasatospora aureofaciens]MBV6697921.1 glycoside hydrolase family 15 protein [Kitasatospora aureofaciens]